MKLAVIGSRKLTSVSIDEYIAEDVEEIVSGGAAGIVSCAAEYAKKNKLTLVEFLPDYKRYGRAAPIIRNKKIVDYADEILIFWDGESRGTSWVIKYAEKTGKPFKIIICKKTD